MEINGQCKAVFCTPHFSFSRPMGNMKKIEFLIFDELVKNPIFSKMAK